MFTRLTLNTLESILVMSAKAGWFRPKLAFYHSIVLITNQALYPFVSVGVAVVTADVMILCIIVNFVTVKGYSHLEEVS